MPTMRFTPFNRETVLMNVRQVAVTGMLFVGLAACSNSDNGTQTAGGTTYIRIVNSTFQREADVATSTPCTFGSPSQAAQCDTVTTTYTAVPIDVLIDSASTYPSSIALAPNSVDTGTAGPKPLSSAAARYHPLSVGVHSFVARVSSLSTPGPSFFVTSSNTEYLPRQFLSNSIFYTLALTGVNPVQPSLATPVLAGPTDFGTGVPLRVDDPFTPPTVTPLSSVPYLQARFRVHNYAEWATKRGRNDGVNVYLTEAPPALIALGALTPQASRVTQRNASSYINVTARDYWLTITPTDRSLIAYQAQVHFDPGEVRSFILQNAMATFHQRAFTISAVGGGPLASGTVFDVPTFKVTNVLDNRFSL